MRRNVVSPGKAADFSQDRSSRWDLPRVGAVADIVTLMATPLPNPSIADRLGGSERTVRNNVSATLVKLRVADRAQVILAARAAALGQRPSPSPGPDRYPPRGGDAR
jgi:hypothetical protein